MDLDPSNSGSLTKLANFNWSQHLVPSSAWPFSCPAFLKEGRFRARRIARRPFSPFRAEGDSPAVVHRPRREEERPRNRLTPVISLMSSTETIASVLWLAVDCRKVIARRKSPSDASINVSSASPLHSTASFWQMSCNLDTKMLRAIRERKKSKRIVPIHKECLKRRCSRSWTGQSEDQIAKSMGSQ